MNQFNMKNLTLFLLLIACPVFAATLSVKVDSVTGNVVSPPAFNTSTELTFASVATLQTEDLSSVATGTVLSLAGYYADGDFGQPVGLVVEVASAGVNSFLLDDGRYGNLYSDHANVRWFGAKGDSDGTTGNGTNDSAAFDSAYAANNNVYIPEGKYLVSWLGLGPQGSIMGAGRGKSILVQVSNADTVIGFDSTSMQNILLSNFGISGDASANGAGHGIHFESVSGSFLTRSKLENIRIDGVAGDGVRFEPGAGGGIPFSITLDNVVCNGMYGDGIYYNGALAELRNCYVQNVPQTGKVGYRIIASSYSLINCNGLDSGETWGWFGGTGGDDRAVYSVGNIINCNVEGYSETGIYMRAGTANILGGTLYASAGETVKGLRHTGDLINGTSLGLISGMRLFETGTWANSTPYHNDSGSVKWAWMHVGTDGSDPVVYSTGLAISFNVSRWWQDYAGFVGGEYRLGYEVDHINVSGYFDMGGIEYSYPTFINFSANDATPSVSKSSRFKTANTSSTTITDFDDGVDGQEIEIIAEDGKTTISQSAFLYASLDLQSGWSTISSTIDDADSFTTAGAGGVNYPISAGITYEIQWDITTTSGNIEIRDGNSVLLVVGAQTPGSFIFTESSGLGYVYIRHPSAGTSDITTFTVRPLDPITLKSRASELLKFGDVKRFRLINDLISGVDSWLEQ